MCRVIWMPTVAVLWSILQPFSDGRASAQTATDTRTTQLAEGPQLASPTEGRELPPPVDEAPPTGRAPGVEASELPPPAPSVEDRTLRTATVDQSLGITLDEAVEDAVVVRSVAPGGPAELAGLRPGDVIESFNARRVTSHQDFRDSIQSLRPGDVLDIDYSRRITARTQVVVGGPSVENRRTVGYAPAPESDVLPEPPREAVDEQLPEPAEARYRVREYDLGRYDTRRSVTPSTYERRVYYYVPRRTPPEDVNRDPPRYGRDRGNRPRPLLPWRR